LWNQTLSALSPVPKEAQDLDESLRRDLGQPDLRYLVAVTGANQAQARERAEAVGHAFDTLVQQGVLAGYQSPARYLPSPSLQQRRRDALPDTATLEARLDEALHTLPVDRAKLQPFVEAVERARHAPLLTPESLQGTALALTVEAMLVEGKSGWTALLPLRPAVGADGKLLEIDSAAVTRALAGFDSDQVIFFDISTQMRRIYGTYFNDALLHALGGLVAIVILLTVALRSLRRLLNVIVPLLLAVAVVIAGLVLSGERLTLLHLIGLLLIFAVGSNYTLFFDGQSKGTETGAGTATPGQSTSGDGDYAVTLASLAVANMTTILGFGVLGLSRVPVLHAIGVTVAPGAALALLFAAILVRRRPAA
jgi:predicted exporter